MSTVNERLMSVGAWSITLRADTPEWLISRFEYYSSIVITRARMRPADVGDQGILDAAVYSGPVTKLPRRDSLTAEGESNRLWLGDGRGGGDILEEAYAPGTPTFVNWWTGLLGTINSVPSPLTAGTLTAITAPAAGELTDEVIDVTRLAVAQLVSDYYGGEYRCNPNFTVDAAAAATLFVTDPRVMVVREPGGTDPSIQSLRLVDVELGTDVDDYTTKVIALGDSARGSDEITSPYYDPQGNTVRRDRIANVDATSESVADELAAAILADVDGPRTGLKLTVDGFTPAAGLAAGDTMYVFDRFTEALQDNTNPVPYWGDIVYPVAIRCLGIKWPLVEGYGVYLRVHDGSSAVYYDLSPHVVWEDQTATTDLEVGAIARSSQLGGGTLTPNPDLPIGRGCVRAIRDTDQSITTGTYTDISFSGVDRDDLGYWAAGSPTRLTIPKTGWYLVGANVNFASNAVGYRRVIIELNDSTYEIQDARGPNPSNATIVTISGLLYLTAGDYLKLVVFQTSGGALNAQTKDFSPTLWIAPQ